MWGTENGEADARRELEFAAFAPLSTFVPLSDTSVMGSVSEGDVDDAHAVASDHGDAAVRPIVTDAIVSFAADHGLAGVWVRW